MLRSSCRRPSDDVSRQRGPSTASSVKRTRALDVSLLCVHARIIFGRLFHLYPVVFDRYCECECISRGGKKFVCYDAVSSVRAIVIEERERESGREVEEASVAT